jgi:ABC-type multidrug transport system ATPase subunit
VHCLGLVIDTFSSFLCPMLIACISSFLFYVGIGKSTILHTLRGTLSLLDGERVENELLRLGCFTQDLAQELDVTKRAVDLVTAYAREGPHGDVFVSDQDARSVLGRLGLSGDKALRPISALSGGEKARVAFAMFALLPSNLYLLDEVSNHLDLEWYVAFAVAVAFALAAVLDMCLLFVVVAVRLFSFVVLFEVMLQYTSQPYFHRKQPISFSQNINMDSVTALQEALSDWGEDKGAVVVISHDKHFCDEIGFTHVATIKDGSLIVEQRDATQRDWDSSGTTTQPTLVTVTPNSSGTAATVATNNGSVVDEKIRKRAYNAPKRIAKIETTIMEKEEAIAKLDSEMLAYGSDVGKLLDLTKKKEGLEAQVSELMEEWEDLEELLEQLAV